MANDPHFDEIIKESVRKMQETLSTVDRAKQVAGLVEVIPGTMIRPSLIESVKREPCEMAWLKVVMSSGDELYFTTVGHYSARLVELAGGQSSATAFEEAWSEHVGDQEDEDLTALWVVFKSLTFGEPNSLTPEQQARFSCFDFESFCAAYAEATFHLFDEDE